MYIIQTASKDLRNHTEALEMLFADHVAHNSRTLRGFLYRQPLVLQLGWQKVLVLPRTLFSAKPTWQDRRFFSSSASDFSFLRFRVLEKPSPGLERTFVGRTDRRDRTEGRVCVGRQGIRPKCILCTAGQVFLRCCTFHGDALSQILDTAKGSLDQTRLETLVKDPWRS